jgi:photosystem II stability/assembly factor-like uncharacterized protein
MNRLHIRFALAVLAAAVLLIAGCGATTSSPSGDAGWQSVNDSFSPSSFSFSSASIGWAVLQDEGLATTTDGGGDWRQCSGTIVGVPTSGIGALPKQVYRLQSAAQVLAAGSSVFLTYYARSLETGGPSSTASTNSGILVSTDRGATWHRCVSLAPSRDSVLYLAVSDARHLWALCAPGQPDHPGPTYLLRSTNAGASWSRLPGVHLGIAGLPGFTSPFSFVDARHGWSWFVPYSGAAAAEVRTTSDGGQSWQEVTQPRGFGLGVFALDGHHAWTVGSALASNTGALYATTDGGKGWHEHLFFAHEPLAAVYFSDIRHGWVVFADSHTHGGGVMETSDGGAVWNKALIVSDRNWQSEGWTFERAGNALFLASADGGGLWSRSVPPGS